MPKITPLSGKKMFKILKIFGFECIRVHGSHHFMRNIYGRTTVIPIHSNELLGVGLLKKILRDTGLTIDDINKYT